MGKVRRIGAAVLAAACAVALLSACEPTYEVRRTEVALAIPCGGGTTVNAEWAIPQGMTPTGTIWLQHGFARSNDAMIDLQTRYAARGWIVVNPTLAAFGSCAINSAAVRTAISSLLAGSTAAGSALEASYDAARTKLGLPAANLPAAVALSGHSAGGALVTSVGASLATSSSAAVRARFEGIVLLDPVESSDGAMAAALPSLTTTPVLTISGADSSCNANGSGTDVLLPKRSGFAGVRLPSGCHCDAEAGSTDATCTIICGTPTAANTSALKQLATDWISDMLTGARTASAYPGGDYFEKTRAAGTIQGLTGTA
jgi:hypothetical protein